MKKSEIAIGSIYATKISGLLRTVRIDRQTSNGNFECAQIFKNDRKVVRSARQLRKSMFAKEGTK